MRVLTAAILVAGLLGMLSLGATAGDCKKGYTYDADQGKCVWISKGSH